MLHVLLNTHTPYFTKAFFLTPLGLQISPLEKLVRVDFDPKTGKGTATIAGEGELATTNFKIKDKDARTVMANLIPFLSTATKALNGYPVEVAETVTAILVDRIKMGMVEIVPEISVELLESLDEDETITGYTHGYMQAYNTDGVQCSRGLLDRFTVELGEPIHARIPVSYLMVVAGNRVAFNQAITLDHNVSDRDYDNKRFIPITTGSVHFASNGFVDIIERSKEYCIAVMPDSTKVTFDLAGPMV